MANANIPSLASTSADALGPALGSLKLAFQGHLGPALAGAASGLGAFGKENLAPALEEAGEFGKEKLGDLGEYVKENAGPAMEKAGEYFKENAGPAMEKAGEYVKGNAGPAMKGAGDYVKENPGKSALYAVSGLTVLAPGLVTGPALWALGWGGAGVRAGSAAAAIQASIGNVVAGSTFATLQSAAMGGPAIAAVNGVVQTTSAVIGFLGYQNWTTT